MVDIIVIGSNIQSHHFTQIQRNNSNLKTSTLFRNKRENACVYRTREEKAAAAATTPSVTINCRDGKRMQFAVCVQAIYATTDGTIKGEIAVHNGTIAHWYKILNGTNALHKKLTERRRRGLTIGQKD